MTNQELNTTEKDDKRERENEREKERKRENNGNNPKAKGHFPPDLNHAEAECDVKRKG